MTETERAPRLQPPAGAYRYGAEGRAAKPGGRIRGAPAAMAWRVAAPRAESPEAALRRTLRPRAPLIWGKEAEASEAFAAPLLSGSGRSGSTKLIWRRPPAGTVRGEVGSPDAPETAAWRRETEVRADRPMTPPPLPTTPAPAAIQPAEMSRLVDEVVRRLDRIGRDERMRRGI